LATNTLIADLTSTISILSHRSTISRQEEPPLTYFPPLPTSPSFSQLKVPTSSSHSRHQWPIPPSTPPYFSLSIDYFSFFLYNSSSNSNRSTTVTNLVSSFSITTSNNNNTDSQQCRHHNPHDNLLGTTTQLLPLHLVSFPLYQNLLLHAERVCSAYNY
jgi:hypothetical protein